jgi:uncharacterized membrane protein
MKLWYLLREMVRLMRRNRRYFLAPVLLILLLAALVAFYVGPGVVVTFIYAGL